MIQGSVRSLIVDLASLLPQPLQVGIRNVLPTARILDLIERLESPRTVILPDGTEWARLDDCPMALLDPGAVQVGTLLYVIGGFRSAADVSNEIHVLDMERRQWLKSIKSPADLPHSHTAVSTDGRHSIYIAGGQFGPHCRPAVQMVYCFNLTDQSWRKLPPLPAPRYAGTMQFWKGRLHFIGGADEDRWTPRADHWSISVLGETECETSWREETPIPDPGMHRCSAVVGDALYVIGGQQGDFRAIEGDPLYTCTGRTKETYLSSVFRLNAPDGEWQRMSDLPIAVSHCDFACTVIDGSIYLFGGQIYKHPDEYYLRLTDAIQAYDPQTDSWRIAGYFPNYLKMPVVGHHRDSVFMTVGQRGQQSSDRPGRFVSSTWVTSKPKRPARVPSPVLHSVSGKNVLLISHELSRSGAPLELLELGTAMIESGAKVRLVSLKADMQSGGISTEFMIPVVPPETALAHASAADLVVLNTAHASTKDWMESCLDRHPHVARKTVWLIHEIDVELLANCAPALRRVRAAVFDSEACRKAWNDLGHLPENTEVIHPGLTPDVFDRAARQKHPFVPTFRKSKVVQPRMCSRSEVRQALGIRDDEILVLSVGSVSFRKGQRLLLHSIARAATERRLPVKLLLVGFNENKQKLGFLAGMEADERRVFNPRLCYMHTPYIDALYAASDVHILNSQGASGRGETFGRATVHAMAFGLPVLCTDAGGAREIVEDGIQGYRYPIGDQGQDVMIDRLAGLVSAPDVRMRMGAAAAARARACFTKERYLAKLDRLLRDHVFPGGPVSSANSAGSSAGS